MDTDLFNPPDKEGREVVLSIDFLKANPNLVLDTCHFDADFKDRLLACFGEYNWDNLIRRPPGDNRSDVETMFYPIYVSNDDTICIPKMVWNDTERAYSVLEPPDEDEVSVLPIKSGMEKRWRHGWDTVSKNITQYRVVRKESPTFLNISELKNPFNYQLKIVKDMQTQKQDIDLPETFNYLIGLSVKTRQCLKDEDRRYLVYKGTVGQKTVVIIWRETAGWEQEDWERDYSFIRKNKLTADASEVYINTDSIVPDVKPIDPLFKRLMFG